MRRASDLASWLGLTGPDDRGGFDLPLAPHLCAPGGPLFGGAALAALVEAGERACGRATVWAQASLGRAAMPPGTLRIEVAEALRGRQLSQLELTATLAGARVARALLSARDADVALAEGERGGWGSAPAPPPPADCPQRRYARPDPASINGALDVRVASDLDDLRDGGRCLLWARARTALPACAAALALIADHVPYALQEALADGSSARSLDGGIRVLAPPAALAARAPGEWVLLEIALAPPAGGIGHGRVRLWSEDGAPLADASQSFRVVAPR